jgi:hypothetical protein
MARQEGQVQLEQSDISHALNIAQMLKGWFSHNRIGEAQQLIQNPEVKVRAEKKRRMIFPRYRDVTAVLVSHPALRQENRMDGCISWKMAQH